MQIVSRLISIFFFTILSWSSHAAQAKTTNTYNPNYSAIEVNPPLVEFIPRTSTDTKISYDAWSLLLEDVVLFMGPSTRTPFKAPSRETGTRISRTHNSPFRLEGNKVLYPHMHDNVRMAIRDYAFELEEIGNKIEIPSLPQDEQLAFWINLHNAVVLSEVAENYPGPQRRPEKIRPIDGSDTTLHDAKLIRIDGIALSLRDIRERIVYPNWHNADVAFAFYLGDASSPSLSNGAYNGINLDNQIKNNAEEYANSLRGMDKGKVSRIYHDIAPWYFVDFRNDLESYFRKRLRAEVFAEYVNAGYRGVQRYDNVVNDITAGYGERGRQRLSLSSDIYSFTLGKDVQQFLIERAKKIEKLRKQPWFRRITITIIDDEDEYNPEID